VPLLDVPGGRIAKKAAERDYKDTKELITNQKRGKPRKRRGEGKT
jgi:hypothetical protein